MPSGLINVGATFQQAMDITFKGLINKFVVVYLDDITVYSKTREDHIPHLKAIFENICHGGGDLARVVISPKGITIDPRRIDTTKRPCNLFWER